MAALPVAQRKIWTREETAKLSELFPGQRWELIEGDLIDKMGQKPPHASTIALLTHILSAAFPGKVRVQLPITIPEPDAMTSEPEPDIVLIKDGRGEFFTRHPSPEDIQLLIEVSDSTLDWDRVKKGRLYARSGIESYWIADIAGRRVIAFSQPASGEYKSTQIYESHEQVGGPGGLAIAVASLFAKMESES